ncbi:MAG: amino acid racemase [Patescibacteria group bacterium]
MKRIGILGGLGPDTTAIFYTHVAHAVAARCGTRPPIHVESLELNLTKEGDYINCGRHKRYYLKQLLDGSQKLERTQSDFVVIPCNTVHEFHEQIAEKISVPVVNLIDVTAREVIRRGWKKVMLLATSRTVHQRLYHDVLLERGIDIHVPSPEDQKHVDDLIRGLLGNRRNANHQKFLTKIITKAETRHIVLGCTDLQLLFPPSEDVVDSTQVLMEHTVNLALA